MQQALLQVWKDEEWHAIYVRQALLQRDHFSRAHLVASAAGPRGDGRYPCANTGAGRKHRTAVAGCRHAGVVVGTLTRQVPRSVRRHLDYCSFKEFCRYNVQTETTAWLCWQRLTELAAQGGIAKNTSVSSVALPTMRIVTAGCSTCSPACSLRATGRETMSPRTLSWLGWTRRQRPAQPIEPPASLLSRAGR